MTKIGIVVGEFNGEITEKMLEVAKLHAQSLNVEIKRIIKVPGVFDMPLAVKKLLETDDIDGVATLGTVIEGSTDHDNIITYTMASKISDLSLEFNKPVTLGVSGPKMTYDESVERIEMYAKNAVEGCVKLIERLK